MPSRSFFYKGRQLPVCARCTGIYIGFAAIIPFAILQWHLPLLWTIALMCPAWIDGLTQAFLNRESNNILRLVTGILAGVSMASFADMIGEWISKYILMIIN